MLFGIDFSPQFVGGEPDVATFRALRSRFGLRRAVIACADGPAFAIWAEAALRAGWTVEAYLELPNGIALPGRIAELADVLLGYHADRLWLAYEDVSAPLPDQAAVEAAVAAGNAVGLPEDCGIYTGSWYWPARLAVDVSALAPLWTASYTKAPPPVDTAFDVAYGGWVRATAVQYAGDVQLLDYNVDLDVWDS